MAKHRTPARQKHHDADIDADNAAPAQRPAPNLLFASASLALIPASRPEEYATHTAAYCMLDGAGTTPIPLKPGNSDQNSDHRKFEPPEFKREKETQTMVRVSSPAKLRPLSELTAKNLVMGVVPGLVICWNLRNAQLSAKSFVHEIAGSRGFPPLERASMLRIFY